MYQLRAMESADSRHMSVAEVCADSLKPVKCEVVVKQEPEWECDSGGDPQCVLYANHEVKNETMVFGPEILQQQNRSPVKCKLRSSLYKES